MKFKDNNTRKDTFYFARSVHPDLGGIAQNEMDIRNDDIQNEMKLINDIRTNLDMYSNVLRNRIID